MRTTKTDQTSWMSRLISVFLGRTCQEVCFPTLWLILLRTVFAEMIIEIFPEVPFKLRLSLATAQDDDFTVCFGVMSRQDLQFALLKVMISKVTSLLILVLVRLLFCPNC